MNDTGPDATPVVDRTSYSPEHIFRPFHKRTRRVLDQIAFSDHGARIVIQLGVALWRYGRYGHRYNSPRYKRVVNKKTMDSEQHAWASRISMRAGILPGFVSPRQCRLIPL